MMNLKIIAVFLVLCATIWCFILVGHWFGFGIEKELDKLWGWLAFLCALTILGAHVGLGLCCVIYISERSNVIQRGVSLMVREKVGNEFPGENVLWAGFGGDSPVKGDVVIFSEGWHP
jgi:hypothetical protein